jgi:hypothetical protein
MTERRNVIVPVVTALGALTNTLPASNATAEISPSANVGQQTSVGTAPQPNTLVSTGQDLLAFTINEQADGSIVAQHVSHASHASHASHHSHYSSR